jgi:hypothetical protein
MSFADFHGTSPLEKLCGTGAVFIISQPIILCKTAKNRLFQALLGILPA